MSTTCGIDLELHKVRTALLNGVNPLNEIRDNLDKLSAEEIMSILDKTDDLVTTALVYGKDYKINNKLLDSDGKVSRYVFKDTGSLAFTKRATDDTKLLGVKKYGKDRVEDESGLKKSLIQANGGTLIHAVNEAIMEELIELDTTGLVKKNNKTLKNSKQIAKENGLMNDHYNQLFLTVKEIFNQILEKQKKVDPKAQAIIKTEKFLFSKDMGTSIDLMYMLSNKKVGVFDYKSMTPYKDAVDKDKHLITANWITPFKLQGMSSQMTNIQTILAKELGLEVESMRIVPIQVEYEMNNKYELTGKIAIIRGGSASSEYLKQIPMIAEKFDNEKLNETLKSLLILKNNTLADLNGTQSPKKRIILNARLSKLQSQINSIQVDRDIQKIYEYFKELVDKYSHYENGSYALKNLDDEFFDKVVDGETIKEKNPHYLSLDELRALRESITTLNSIVTSTEEFMKELNITDKEKFNLFRQIESEISKRSQVMISDINQRLLHRVLTDKQILELKSGGTRFALPFSTLGTLKIPKLELNIKVEYKWN